MNRSIRRANILTKLVSKILYAKLTRQRCPIFMGLYITNRCNLRCSYCFVNVDNRMDNPCRRGFTKDEIFKQVDELYAMGMRWVFMLGGEPLEHENIGEIVKYITDKGILLHLLTNGTLIEQKIDAIEAADGVCVSIDGGEEATDKLRGKGVFRRALRGAEIALSRGMNTRIHAVLNKYSFNDMEMLANIAREKGLTITLSPINDAECKNDPNSEFVMTDEEYRNFYIQYRKLKEKGYPIANSYYAIDKVINWPIGYHERIAPEQSFHGYKVIPCVMAETHACIDAEGAMFTCIQQFMDGLNIKEVGIKEAWDYLPNKRKRCNSCASMNTIETAAYLRLRPEIIMEGIKFFFGRRKSISNEKLCQKLHK